MIASNMIFLASPWNHLPFQEYQLFDPPLDFNHSWEKNPMPPAPGLSFSPDGGAHFAAPAFFLAGSLTIFECSSSFHAG
jgi:hypothetical protein